jgi:hypothetical protein
MAAQMTAEILCESCQRRPWAVLLSVAGGLFAVCVDCAADPEREVTR